MNEQPMIGSGALRGSASDWSRSPGSVSDRVVKMLEQSAGLGFLGPMPVSAQISHALGFVAAARRAGAKDPRRVLDLGSGAGMPGWVLADCWPLSEIVLLDSSQRRTEFLESQVVGWNRHPEVRVVRDRAEVVGRSPLFREQFDVVTARSFGGPAVTIECGAPLVEVGGIMIVSEPPADERRWPEAGLQEFGLEAHEPFRSDSGYNYQVLVKVLPIGERYPRRTGVPAKRPLF